MKFLRYVIYLVSLPIIISVVFFAINQAPAHASCISTYGQGNKNWEGIKQYGKNATDIANLINTTLNINNACTVGFAWLSDNITYNGETQGFISLGAYVHGGNGNPPNQYQSDADCYQGGHVSYGACSVSIEIDAANTSPAFTNIGVNDNPGGLGGFALTFLPGNTGISILGNLSYTQLAVKSYPITFDPNKLPPGGSTQCISYNLYAYYGSADPSRVADQGNGRACYDFYREPPPPGPGPGAEATITITKHGPNTAEDRHIGSCPIFAYAGTPIAPIIIPCNPFNYDAGRFSTISLKVSADPLASYSMKDYVESAWSITDIRVNGTSVGAGPDLASIPVTANQTTNVDIYYKQNNQPPIGSLDTGCANLSDPQVTGWAFDPSDPAKAIFADLYFDGPAGQGTGFRTTADQPRPDLPAGTGGVVPAWHINHGFSYGVPSQYLDGRSHTVYAYAIGIDKNDQPDGNNPQLNGSPLTFRCQIPPAQFHPWLQTRAGDVTANGTIRGQQFNQPGSRTNYYYGEQAEYVAPGPAGQNGTQALGQSGSTGVIDDTGSLNPPGVKKSVELYGPGSAVTADYTGPIAGLSMRMRGLLYGNQLPAYKLTITNSSGQQVRTSTGSVGAGYSIENLNIATTDVNSALPSDTYHITLEFTNDAYGGTELTDRNLVVDALTVYGNQVTGPEADYLRVAPTLSSSVISNFFCSTNRYFVGGDVISQDCPPAGQRGYNVSDGVGGNFGSIVSSVQQAIKTSGSAPCSPYTVGGTLPPSGVLSPNCDNGSIYQMGTGAIGNYSVKSGRATLFVNGTLTINANITNATSSAARPEQLPNLAIVATGGINIGPNVTQLDATLYTPQKIATCQGAVFAYPSNVCNKSLHVSGQLIAGGGFVFGRNFFNRYQPNRDPAEQFSLDGQGIIMAPPGLDAVFASLDDQLTFGKGELSPRLK